jgi:hypothetical protein
LMVFGKLANGEEQGASMGAALDRCSGFRRPGNSLRLKKNGEEFVAQVQAKSITNA